MAACTPRRTHSAIHGSDGSCATGGSAQPSRPSARRRGRGGDRDRLRDRARPEPRRDRPAPRRLRGAQLRTRPDGRAGHRRRRRPTASRSSSSWPASPVTPTAGSPRLGQDAVRQGGDGPPAGATSGRPVALARAHPPRRDLAERRLRRAPHLGRPHRLRPVRPPPEAARHRARARRRADQHLARLQRHGRRQLVPRPRRSTSSTSPIPSPAPTCAARSCPTGLPEQFWRFDLGFLRWYWHSGYQADFVSDDDLERIAERQSS